MLGYGDTVNTYKREVVGVVICDPGVIVSLAIVCGSYHRFHIQCMHIHMKAAKPTSSYAHKATSGISSIHMSR